MASKKAHSRKAVAGVPPFVPISDDQRISTEQLSRWIPFRPITWRIFRLRNEGPPYEKINRAVFYKVGDVKRWLESNKQLSAN